MLHFVTPSDFTNQTWKFSHNVQYISEIANEFALCKVTLRQYDPMSDFKAQILEHT